VAKDRIDEQADEEAVDEICYKFGPFCHSARHNCRSRSREDDLEHPEGVTPLAVGGAVVRGEEEERAACEAVARAKHEPETDRPVGQTAE
jgi:hypothetical protein